MDRKKQKEKIEVIKRKSGKSTLAIRLDLLWCGFRYQAGYMDYLIFEFWRLNGKQRKSYVTTGWNNKYAKCLNSKDDWDTFDKKELFNEAFKPYLGREFLYLDKTSDEDALAFINKRDIFMAKPHDGMCGIGVTKIDKLDFPNDLAVLKYLKEKNLSIIEDFVSQHDKMNKLHPNSVNTIRLITILKDDKVNVVASFLRIGNGDNIDNFNNGGMTCPIDLKTGKVIDVAVDKAGSTYAKHPVTDTPIVGFEIPYWKEVLALKDIVGKIVPGVRFVGWDIAITPTGPIVIEGNQYPSNDIYQMPVHLKDGYGYLPKFQDIEKI